MLVQRENIEKIRRPSKPPCMLPHLALAFAALSFSLDDILEALLEGMLSHHDCPEGHPDGTANHKEKPELDLLPGGEFAQVSGVEAGVCHCRRDLKEAVDVTDAAKRVRGSPEDEGRGHGNRDEVRIMDGDVIERWQPAPNKRHDSTSRRVLVEPVMPAGLEAVQHPDG